MRISKALLLKPSLILQPRCRQPFSISWIITPTPSPTRQQIPTTNQLTNTNNFFARNLIRNGLVWLLVGVLEVLFCFVYEKPHNHLTSCVVHSQAVWFPPCLQYICCQEWIFPEVCQSGLEAESPEVGNAAIAFLIWSSLMEPCGFLVWVYLFISLFILLFWQHSVWATYKNPSNCLIPGLKTKVSKILLNQINVKV